MQTVHDGGESDLVSVAYANDPMEAELIQGLLEDAGIPSALEHLGIDGPQLGFGLLNPGGGARRVMVRAGQSQEARTLLAEALVEGEPEDFAEVAAGSYSEEAAARKPRGYGLLGAYARIYAWSLAAFLLAFAIFLLLRIA
jgi:Putative prokaryotic signal transducing protein